MARILIVDDDELLRQVYASALDGAGHYTEEAEHGGRAIEKLERVAFDLVLIDLLMPVREGIETIMEVKRRWPSVKVIAVSAGAGRLHPGTLLDLASGLGADEALMKPASRDVLLASVARQLRE
ncbi:response regulator [Caulobacter radicis]|jgi:CheY-like chemotaxis protein|uniref:response regulator n=1 Tax=Caulobacter radicis TaxID=2172650 RepID=UPI000D5668F0|nr:response regulator [Caulobacter radicis]PVM87593.1 response regulator [Caulobacter radicis]